MEILLYLTGITLLLITTIIILKINSLKNIIYKKPDILSDKKILIIYYSGIGNSKSVAEKLHTIVGGDIKEIELVEKYPSNIFTMSKLIRKQMKTGYLPQINEYDISDYDVIFVGSPVWNFSISLPVQAFLKNNNFENKILIPFFTCSGGVNKNKVINNIKNSTKAKDIKKPAYLFENGIFLIKEQLIKWLNNI